MTGKSRKTGQGRRKVGSTQAAGGDPKASSTRTPGGYQQTSIYLTDKERKAIAQRAFEESQKKGKRVSLGEVVRAAIRQYLDLDE